VSNNDASCRNKYTFPYGPGCYQTLDSLVFSMDHVKLSYAH